MKNEIFDDYKKVFELEIEELCRVKDWLNSEMMEMVIEVLHNCTGKVVLCGMGKPGHIARKISATMSSLGIHSYFLHPAEARHGDLGTLASDDVIIIISNSGETSEVCELLPSTKMMGIPIIAITSYKDSTLAKYADYLITLPIMREASSLNLAPTSSTTAALVLGDALAVVVSERRKFSKENFALYHPAGALGRKLTTTVYDLTHKKEDDSLIQIGSTLEEAICAMSKNGLGAVAVIDKEQFLMGLVTDGDLRRYMHSRGDIYQTKVDEVMTKKPIVISSDELAIEALKIMEQGDKPLSVLPVIDNMGHVVGIIRNHDIIRLGII